MGGTWGPLGIQPFKTALARETWVVSRHSDGRVEGVRGMTNGELRDEVFVFRATSVSPGSLILEDNIV